MALAWPSNMFILGVSCSRYLICGCDSATPERYPRISWDEIGDVDQWLCVVILEGARANQRIRSDSRGRSIIVDIIVDLEFLGFKFSWLARLAGSAGWLYSVSSLDSWLSTSPYSVCNPNGAFPERSRTNGISYTVQYTPSCGIQTLLACYSIVKITMDHSLSLPVGWL